jgi:HSP20 family protein
MAIRGLSRKLSTSMEDSMLRSQYSLLPQSSFGEDVFPMLRSVRRALDSALQDVWNVSPEMGRSFEREFSPHVSVSEDEKTIRVQAELPGIKENDVEVTYERGYLILRGEKKEEERRESQSGATKFSECRYGSFERRIPVRAEVQEDQIQANFDRGILTVSLPKTEEARAQARRIQVKPGAPKELEQAPSGAPGKRIQPSSEGAQPAH